jgi:hypothetical protein
MRSLPSFHPHFPLAAVLFALSGGVAFSAPAVFWPSRPVGPGADGRQRARFGLLSWETTSGSSSGASPRTRWSGATCFARRGEGSPRTGTCFIATAACGAPHAPSVAALREFREVVLRSSRAGRGLIRWYERLSLRPAETISRSETLRALVRHAIVGPAPRLARLWLCYGGR